MSCYAQLANREEFCRGIVQGRYWGAIIQDMSAGMSMDWIFSGRMPRGISMGDSPAKMSRECQHTHTHTHTYKFLSGCEEVEHRTLQLS